jgi:glycosyltransferase involved in cell wall biosynthesis
VRLDVLIPTFRRHWLLKRALASLASAPVPAGLVVQVFVIDNDAHADFGDLPQTASHYPFRVTWIHEPRPGKSSALNTGLALCTGDYVGFVDDDEEI